MLIILRQHHENLNKNLLYGVENETLLYDDHKLRGALFYAKHKVIPSVKYDFCLPTDQHLHQ